LVKALGFALLGQSEFAILCLLVDGSFPISGWPNTPKTAACHPVAFVFVTKCAPVAACFPNGYGTARDEETPMTITMILLLGAAGFLSGAVNAIAGGGTFLTFGAMTLAGIPPIVANATSSIVQFPGYVTSTLAYRKEISSRWRSAILLAVVSAIGALVGSMALLALDNPSFRALVPWLLAAATTVFAAGPWLKPSGSAERPANSVACVVGQALTAIYGGFFGAGMGIMMLAVLGLTTGGSYHHLNALKNMLAMIIAAVAIAVFIGGGVIAWPETLVMMPAGALGGYCGVWLARRVPQAVLRWCVVAVGFGLTIYYFVTG
jgi:uncharacterized membrane protein YfcA